METYGITVEDSAIERVRALRAKQGLGGDHYLRIAVVGGGCSGFQYEMSMDDTVNNDDLVFDEAVVIDQTSRQILQSAIVKYKEDMMNDPIPKIRRPDFTDFWMSHDKGDTASNFIIAGF